ncbi:ribosome rescue GTPase HflX [Thiothrix nivea]|uniref:GTPase HflX n=1 Tax=Thiothrix nivea (strain ATCC 35100 / DSM 5205 / JP2) TaxID=870187 RepID=A0A656HEM3_THINJ|nr:ribosome rescue GTPase HflX [Thiothrix nivea]EIJ35541.1 GTP-binding proten HflX [Thiothrix nivea DSM 5205]
MELFERPGGGERAVLVQISFNAAKSPQDEKEFVELAYSAGAQLVGFVAGSRQSPDPRYFIGEGKAEEIRLLLNAKDANLAIFDHSLSPAQERNLEKRLQCRVLDRTGLILDIFAQRARSHEGKLQVELAQLKHLSTRLVRGWTHLERQKGGIGLRGPGETQLETDRRLIGERIKQINKRLEKVQNQREQGRQARKKAEIPTVSLVGYTNAGKSTLFNALTEAEVYAADQLFATLDPTLRKVQLPNQQETILADTVGFIRHLPHDLVAAFRSTLQETIDADLLLHVIDSHDEQLELYREQVNKVIAEIGAENVPQIEVMNKIDLGGQTPHVEEGNGITPTRIYVSAQKQSGLDILLEYLGNYFAGQMFRGELNIPPLHARLRARLYADKAIQQESITDEGNFRLKVAIDQRRLNQYLHEEGLLLTDL